MDDLARARAVLGVTPDASASELKRRYKALVKTWHPDRFTADPEGQREATIRMRAINEAYDVAVAGLETYSPPPAPPAAPMADFGSGRRLTRSEIEGMVRSIGKDGPVDWLLARVQWLSDRWLTRGRLCVALAYTVAVLVNALCDAWLSKTRSMTAAVLLCAFAVSFLLFRRYLPKNL